MEKIGVSQDLRQFLKFQVFPVTNHERAVLSTPEMEMMLASLTFLMSQVSPKDLPCHIQMHKTVFEFKDDASEASSEGISMSDFNARIALPRKGILKNNNAVVTPVAQGCQR